MGGVNAYRLESCAKMQFNWRSGESYFEYITNHKLFIVLLKSG